MGNHVPLDQQGDWYIADTAPAVIPAAQVASVIGDAPRVCARISDGSHALVPDVHGGYDTGNCVPIGQ